MVKNHGSDFINSLIFSLVDHHFAQALMSIMVWRYACDR